MKGRSRLISEKELMAPTAVGLIGEPLKRFRISEWESLEKLQTYEDSPKRQAL